MKRLVARIVLWFARKQLERKFERARNVAAYYAGYPEGSFGEAKYKTAMDLAIVYGRMLDGLRNDDLP